jgi:hypothetical protein
MAAVVTTVVVRLFVLSTEPHRFTQEVALGVTCPVPERWRVTASSSVAGAFSSPPGIQPTRVPVLVLPQPNRRSQVALGDEVDEIFRREVKSLPAYAKAQAASGSGVAPPVDEMNQLIMGLANAAQRSFHLLADRMEQMQKT